MTLSIHHPAHPNVPKSPDSICETQPSLPTPPPCRSLVKDAFVISPLGCSTGLLTSHHVHGQSLHISVSLSLSSKTSFLKYRIRSRDCSELPSGPQVQRLAHRPTHRSPLRRSLSCLSNHSCHLGTSCAIFSQSLPNMLYFTMIFVLTYAVLAA